VYPIPAKLVYAHTRRKQKEIHDIKNEIEENTLLTAAQSREVRNENRKLKEDHEKSIQQMFTQIESKQDEINALKDELDRSQKPEGNTSKTARENQKNTHSLVAQKIRTSDSKPSQNNEYSEKYSPKIVEIAIDGVTYKDPDDFEAKGLGEANIIKLTNAIKYGKIFRVEFKLNRELKPDEFIKRSEPGKGWVKTDETSFHLRKDEHEKVGVIIAVHAPKEWGSGDRAVSNKIHFSY
jgi:hypothetical protein